MVHKIVMLCLCLFTLVHAKMPDESEIVPVTLGDTTPGLRDHDLWFSFTLEERQSVCLSFPWGNDLRDVYIYRGTEELDFNNCESRIFLYDYVEGTYYVKVTSYIAGPVSADILIEPINPDTIPELSIGEPVINISDRKVLDHFYRFRIDEPSEVKIIRIPNPNPSRDDADLEVRIWNRDTSFILLESKVNSFHEVTGRALLDSGEYFVELVINHTYRISYTIEVSAGKIDVNEKEDNSSIDSAEEIGLRDTIKAMFFGIDTANPIDSIDWFKLTLEKERLIYLNSTSVR